MSDFKNCLVTRGTSNLRYKNCVSQIDISDIDNYAALINANGAKLDTIEYVNINNATKLAFLNPSPLPVVGVSSFYTSVVNQLNALSFTNTTGRIYENENSQVRYTKIKLRVFTGIGSGYVPIEINFTETSCEEFDISQIDVNPLHDYIMYEVLYNGQYILADLQNVGPFVVNTSIQALDFIKNKHYITSWSQAGSPLVNPADPYISSVVGWGGLKSIVIIGQTSGGIKNLTEVYVANEVFYTIPSATIDFTLEVDCSDLSKIKLTDITHPYNVNNYPHGYGGPTPNYPNLADITGTEIKLYDGSNVLIGNATDLGYIPSFSPQTFTYIQASELGINAFRRNKEYRIEYIVHVNDGNTISCGQKIFIIDQCGGAIDPFEQLEDCVIKRLKVLFEKECSDSCNEDEEKEIDSLIKLKTKFEVLKSSLEQDSECVSEIDIDKLLEQCKNGCAGC